MAKFYEYPDSGVLVGDEKLVVEQSGTTRSIEINKVITDMGLLVDITSENIEDLTNVTITTPSNGEALIYQTGVWVNGTVASTITDLTDTTITTPSDGEALTYQSGDWVNAAVAGVAEITPVLDVSVPLSTYPIGVTRMFEDTGMAGYPATSGNIVTINNDDSNGSQTFYDSFGDTHVRSYGPAVAFYDDFAFDSGSVSFNLDADVLPGYGSIAGGFLSVRTLAGENASAQSYITTSANGSGDFVTSVMIDDYFPGADNWETGVYIELIDETTTFIVARMQLARPDGLFHYYEYIDGIYQSNFASGIQGGGITEVRFVKTGTNIEYKLVVGGNLVNLSAVYDCTYTLSNNIDVKISANVATNPDVSDLFADISSVSITTTSNVWTPFIKHVTDGLVGAINDLTDVTITTPSDAETLVYSGGEWINTSLAVVDLGTLASTCSLTFSSTDTEIYRTAILGAVDCTFAIVTPPTGPMSATLELVTGGTVGALTFTDATPVPTIEINKTYRMIWTPKYTSTGYWLQVAEIT